MKILIKYPNVCFQGGPPLPGLKQTLLRKWSGRAPLPWNDMFEVRDGKEAKQNHNDFCVSQVRHFFSNLWAHSRTGCRGSAPSTTSSIWSKQQNPVCWSTWVQSLLNLSLRISWWCKDKPKYSREDQLMVQGQTKIVGKPGIQWNPPPGLRMSSWKGTF